MEIGEEVVNIDFMNIIMGLDNVRLKDYVKYLFLCVKNWCDFIWN